MKSILLTFLTLTAMLLRSHAGETMIWVGCYTDKPTEQGISLLRLDEEKGELTDLGVRAPANSPSFLTLVGNGWLYAVSEGAEGGSVMAYRITTPSGNLTKLSEQPTKSAGPCHLAVDEKRKTLITANYGGGSITVFPLDKEGKILASTEVIKYEGKSKNPQRQKESHAHGVYFSPANDFALVTDLGTDKIHLYRHDPDKAALVPGDPPSASVPAGSGARHAAWGADGNTFYVNNELTSSVTVFQWDKTRGSLTAIQTIPTIAKPNSANSTAEIAVHPNGKFLYVSNRGEDTLAGYAIEPRTGKLTLLGHTPAGGKIPRHFAIHPNGKWMVVGHQESSTIQLFAVDAATGQLAPRGTPIASPKPVCFAFWVN